MYKYWGLVVAVLLISCSRVQLKKAVKGAGLDHIHSGILVEDLQSGKVLFEKNSEQYFMPASNMKLLTFLVANRYLKEKTPAFAYKETADSLFFWGAGDPSFLHPDFKNLQLIDFLQSKNQVLVYAEEQSLKPLGDGWAWDDYPDYYSAEVSTLPMYGNLVSFTKDKENWIVSPGFFRNSTYYTEENRIVRDRNENRFYINPKMRSFNSPFITSPELTTQMLVGLVKKTINYEQKYIPNNAEIVLSTPLDSLLKPLMHHSDNMIAEQLLVQIGTSMKRSQKVDAVISTIQKDADESFIKDIKWVDGSGLSRYNLMRPQDLVGILKAIHKEFSEDRWKALLPQAGKTGTLKNIEIKNPELLIYAKSGSFANTYNLSGFARTPKGKWLAFSVMSNLANQSVSDSKKQIVEFLNQLSTL
mgnify:CR=1 FL=1